MASTIVLTPSTDKTGATDTAAINTALGNVGSGGSVVLGPGDWYTDAPLDIRTGPSWRASRGDQRADLDLRGRFGHPPGRGFQRGRRPQPAGRFRGADKRPRHCQRHRLTGRCGRDLLSRQRQRPGGSARLGGQGQRLRAGLLPAAGADGDGLWMSRCMFQRTGKSAVYRPVNDANIHNVHIQYAGDVAGPADGHGFFSDAGSAGNMTYVGCRADLCRGSGWLIDHKGTFGDATKLVGCSTERNSQDGVLITNSSAAGHRLAVPGHHQRLLLRGRRDKRARRRWPGHRWRVRRHPGPGTEPGVHRRHHRRRQHHRRGRRDPEVRAGDRRDRVGARPGGDDRVGQRADELLHRPGRAGHPEPLAGRSPGYRPDRHPGRRVREHGRLVAHRAGSPRERHGHRLHPLGLSREPDLSH